MTKLLLTTAFATMALFSLGGQVMASTGPASTSISAPAAVIAQDAVHVAGLSVSFGDADWDVDLDDEDDDDDEDEDDDDDGDDDGVDFEWEVEL